MREGANSRFFVKGIGAGMAFDADHKLAVMLNKGKCQVSLRFMKTVYQSHTSMLYKAPSNNRRHRKTEN